MQVATNTSLACAVIEPMDEQNIVFVGSNNRLYVLNRYEAAWNEFDIFDLIAKNPNNHGVPTPPNPGSSGPRGGTPLAAFAYTAFGETSGIVAYIGNDNHIQQLLLSGNTWSCADLTALTGAPAPAGNSALAGYAWNGNGTRHVIYVASNGDVVELYAPGGKVTPANPQGWAYSDLSQKTGATLPKGGSPLTGYAFESQGTEHVVYIAKDNTIRELYYSVSEGWRMTNLSQTTNAPAPKSNTPLAGYMTNFDTNQHVVYITESNDIQELYWAGRWEAGQPDLTQATATPQPAGDSALAGWSCEYERIEHVVYLGTDGDLHELWHADGQPWQTTDLSVSAGSGATPALGSCPLIGYPVEVEQTDHVIYVDVNKKAHELYRSGQTWFAGELS